MSAEEPPKVSVTIVTNGRAVATPVLRNITQPIPLLMILAAASGVSVGWDGNATVPLPANVPIYVKNRSPNRDKLVYLDSGTPVSVSFLG